MKRNVLPIFLAFFSLITTSCGKSLTSKEVEQFVKDNYSLAKAEEAFSSGEAHTTVNITKSEGLFADSYREGSNEVTTDVKVSENLISPLYIAALGDNCKYSLTNDSLSIFYEEDALSFAESVGLNVKKGDKAKGKITETTKTNEYGLYAYYEAKYDIDIKITTSILGVELNTIAILQGSTKTTYTWKK